MVLQSPPIRDKQSGLGSFCAIFSFVSILIPNPLATVMIFMTASLHPEHYLNTVPTRGEERLMSTASRQAHTHTHTHTLRVGIVQSSAQIIRFSLRQNPINCCRFHLHWCSLCVCVRSCTSGSHLISAPHRRSPGRERSQGDEAFKSRGG